MNDTPFTEVARAIHASGWQLVAAATGGGSGALAALVQTPGASRSVLEARIPYAWAALVDWLGAEPEQASCAATARAMAMASLARARRLAPAADPRRLAGLGVTASLASDRPKRGAHRVHAAVQTGAATACYSVELTKGRRDRAGEEQLAAALALSALAAECGVDAAPLAPLLPGRGDDATDGEALIVDSAVAAPALADVLCGVRRCAVLQRGSTSEYAEPPATGAVAAAVVFPGAFNPVHRGHLAMASAAEQRLGLPVAWELSLANVDKPAVDFLSVRDRLATLRAADAVRPVAITWAPTFREKAELFPGATFVVGADTIARIGHERYYAGDAVQRDAAIAAIADAGCRFLVFGRATGGAFQSLDDLNLPPRLAALCTEVPAEEFRDDVSSTELRAQSDRA